MLKIKHTDSSTIPERKREFSLKQQREFFLRDRETRELRPLKKASTRMKSGAAPLSRPCGGGSGDEQWDPTSPERHDGGRDHGPEKTRSDSQRVNPYDRAVVRKKRVHVQANQSGEEGAVSRRSRAYQASFMGIRTEKAQPPHQKPNSLTGLYLRIFQKLVGKSCRRIGFWGRLPKTKGMDLVV